MSGCGSLVLQMDSIPLIDVSSLFGPDSPTRAATDSAIRDAAGELGFLVLTGLPETLRLDAESRTQLLQIFSLPETSKRRLWRKASAPDNANVYRGYFPIDAGIIKEGIDIGPERRGAAPAPDALLEATPLPEEMELPGWRAHMRRMFAELEQAGAVLLHSIARGLGLPQQTFEDAFRSGNSTFRLITYPPWPAVARQHGLPLRHVAGLDGSRRYDIGGEHVDSGFVTLLQQDSIGGLQARLRNQTWVDVPPLDGSLVVNFGKLLERWTGGRIRATEHRVLGNDRERRSIPFFYEPRVDARIEPLPLEGVEPFEPFEYGDHVWEAMTKFSEFSRARRWPETGS